VTVGFENRVAIGLGEHVDRLEFDAPLGAVGRVVERVVLAGYLRKLIRERDLFLEQLAEQRA
jgi:hypothetical protein